MQQNKSSVLFISHNWGGGTEQQLNDIAQTLIDRFNIFVLIPHNKGFLLRYLKKKRFCDVFIPFINFNDIFELNNKLSWLVYKTILMSLEIKLLHVHHLIGHSHDIFRVAEKFQIPIIITINDYYSICPKIFLINNNKLCQSFSCINECNQCLKNSGLDDVDINAWRNAWNLTFSAIKKIVVPNRSVIKHLSNCYINIQDKVEIIEPGFHIEKYYVHHLCCESIKFEQPINIAFIGHLDFHKGEDIFYELAKESYSSVINWFIIGDSSKLKNPGYYEDYHVTITGRYSDKNELFTELIRRKINICIFPSICPETYSYTLTESWFAGIPPLVSRLGALGDRVLDTNAGWVTDSDLISFKTTIEFILTHEKEMESVKSRIRDLNFPTVQEMSLLYQTIFTNCTTSTHNLCVKEI